MRIRLSRGALGVLELREALERRDAVAIGAGAVLEKGFGGAEVAVGRCFGFFGGPAVLVKHFLGV